MVLTCTFPIICKGKPTTYVSIGHLGFSFKPTVSRGFSAFLQSFFFKCFHKHFLFLTVKVLYT